MSAALSSIILTGRLLLPGTDLPALTGDILNEHPLAAEHAIYVSTSQWRHFSLDHTFTTKWVSDPTPRVGVIDYAVRLNYALTGGNILRITHGSIHNVDRYGGPIRRYNALEVHVPIK